MNLPLKKQTCLFSDSGLSQRGLRCILFSNPRTVLHEPINWKWARPTFPQPTSSLAFFLNIFSITWTFLHKELSYWFAVVPLQAAYLLWAFALMSPFFFSSLQSYLDKSSVMFSSLIPPNTLNFFKLQTWVFSYFPKVMLWTTAGLSSFKTKNWRKDRRGKQTWWINMRSLWRVSVLTEE